jgi:hypothetical protein
MAALCIESNMNLNKLESSVKKSRVLACSIFILIVAGYFFWFLVINSQRLSVDTSSWGAFGDFVGGILNPLIAFLAFYWLTVSVLIQKKELEETKNALVGSSVAQAKQVEISVIEIQLNVINIQLEAKNAYKNIIINNGYGIRQNGSFGIKNVLSEDGEIVEYKGLLEKINENIDVLTSQQVELIEKLLIINSNT